jgi:hypothetical protein
MKVIQAQMPPPPLSRLVEAYGDSSPMGLLWTFMGASRGYNAFAGGAEMLAGLLLFVPGLTALGALLAIAVMSNVFMLNMCYDVPVKLFSFHLLLMAVFLAIPDLRRLINLFVLRRKVQLSVAEPLFHRRWLNRGSLVAQFLFGLFVITASLYGAHQSQSRAAAAVRGAALATCNLRLPQSANRATDEWFPATLCPQPGKAETDIYPEQARRSSLESRFPLPEHVPRHASSDWARRRPQRDRHPSPYGCSENVSSNQPGLSLD